MPVLPDKRIFRPSGQVAVPGIARAPDALLAPFRAAEQQGAAVGRLGQAVSGVGGTLFDIGLKQEKIDAEAAAKAARGRKSKEDAIGKYVLEKNILDAIAQEKREVATAADNIDPDNPAVAEQQYIAAATERFKPLFAQSIPFGVDAQRKVDARLESEIRKNSLFMFDEQRKQISKSLQAEHTIRLDTDTKRTLSQDPTAANLKSLLDEELFRIRRDPRGMTPAVRKGLEDQATNELAFTFVMSLPDSEQAIGFLTDSEAEGRPEELNTLTEIQRLDLLRGHKTKLKGDIKDKAVADRFAIISANPSLFNRRSDDDQEILDKTFDRTSPLAIRMQAGEETAFAEAISIFNKYNYFPEDLGQILLGLSEGTDASKRNLAYKTAASLRETRPTIFNSFANGAEFGQRADDWKIMVTGGMTEQKATEAIDAYVGSQTAAGREVFEAEGKTITDKWTIDNFAAMFDRTTKPFDTPRAPVGPNRALFLLTGKRLFNHFYVRQSGNGDLALKATVKMMRVLWRVEIQSHDPVRSGEMRDPESH